MSHEAIRAQLRRPLRQKEYKKIRRLWMEHSIAEDARDIPGLMATLTKDCVYEMVQTGIRWEGHAGAEQFYADLLTAFPAVHFDLMNIVIGPQGVFEEALVTGTHEGNWMEVYPATGKAITLKTVIFFPWDSNQQLFTGERMYIDSDDDLLG